MSSRSLGELLLRPSTLARTPLCQSCTIRQIPTSWTLRRHMSDTPNPGAARPQPPEPRSEHDSQPSASPRPQKTSAEQTSQAIDNLFSRPARRQRPQSTSADDFRASQATDDIFGSAFSNGSSPRRSRAPPRLAFDDMLPSGSGGSAIPTLSGKPSEAAALAAQQEETFTNFPRLNPSYGRSVSLDPSRGRDIVRGISMLGSLMARNSVKRDFNKQRFHERPGLKRKRLASERWRARFKKGFTHVTARVSELTRKGW